MRLCIDCKHYRPQHFGAWPFRKEEPRYGKCAAVDPSPVDGAAQERCYSARFGSGKCGPDAKLFESRAAEAA